MSNQIPSNSPFQPNLVWLLLVTVWAVVGTTGCGSGEPVAIENAATVTPKVAENKTQTVTAANESQVPSPATNSITLPDVDTSPESVCEMFMENLNRGERVKAERLLSSSALSTTAKAGLYLQPIGGKNAKVKINQAVYATDKQQLAQVECVITEVEDGKEITDELTWLARKSKSGWRIFGFMLRDDKGVGDFLSFENVRDVDAILQMSQATPDRQAANTQSTEQSLN